MADDERPADDESNNPDERADDAEASVAQEDATQPGDWEKKPADEEDLRHDDSSEPLAEPLGDDADDDLAEQEAGDVTAGDDEGFDRPDETDETEPGEAGQRLEGHAEPLLQGSEVKTPIGGIPTLSIAGIVAFIAIFLIAFFAFWYLLGGIGILVGIIVGTALGLFAVKLLADRAR